MGLETTRKMPLKLESMMGSTMPSMILAFFWRRSRRVSPSF